MSFKKIIDMGYGVFGVVAGILLLIVQEWLWGAIGLAAGIYLIWRTRRKKAKAAPKAE